MLRRITDHGLRVGLASTGPLYPKLGHDFCSSGWKQARKTEILHLIVVVSR
eukprot:13282.XXX_913541_913693_1 [CDS] Oithona nana genome sequencing.